MASVQQEPQFSMWPDDLRKGFDTPVKEFIGELVKVDVRAREFPDRRNPAATRTAYYITFGFKQPANVHNWIIRSDTPWISPILDVDIPHSGGMENSAYGTMGKSLFAAGATKEEMQSIKVGLLGEVMHWSKTPGHDYGEDFNAVVDPETGMKPHRVVVAWECLSIEGRTGTGTSPNGQVSIEDKLLTLLDGKTLSEFGSHALVLDEVKGNMQLQQRLIDQSWLAEKQASGKVSLDSEARYHVTT